MPGFVPTFVFFAMPMGVDEKQDGKNHPADKEHDNQRLVLPYFRHKGEKVFEEV